MTNADDAGKHLENISPGSEVEIILKEDRTGKNPVRGIISDILTHSSFHPYGIMVQLEDGAIGRVQRIISNKDKVTIRKPESYKSSKYTSLNNVEKIQQFLVDQKKPYCDDCVSEILSIFPRQQINQISRRLEAKGTITRNHGVCYECRRAKIVNRDESYSDDQPKSRLTLVKRASRSDIIQLDDEEIESGDPPSKIAITLPKIKEIDFPLLVKKGENEFVEFKSSSLWSKNLTEQQLKDPNASPDVRKFGRELSRVIIGKTIAGFMNTQGGNLIIGIKENKTKKPDEIIGIESEFGKLEDPCTDGYRRMIVDSIIRKYFPSEIFNYFSDHIKITFPTIEDKTLCWIQIQRSKIPVFLTIRNEEYFFIRLDAESRELDGKQMGEYCAKKF
jgi:uncharacterized repeat protein (TIGR03833 family)